MNEELKNKLREEYTLFMESRCIKHPDFFPDECENEPSIDWWLSKIKTLLKEQREELVEKIKEINEYNKKCSISLNYDRTKNNDWNDGYNLGLKYGYDLALKEILFFINKIL